MSARERTAFHEAGHAVIGIRRGMRLLRVTITPEDGKPGSCEWDAITPPRDRIDMLVAGAVAAVENCRRDEREAAIEYGRQDYYDVLDTLLPLMSGQFNLAQAKFEERREAVRLELREPECAKLVQEIAATLLARDTLSGEEVAAVLRDE